MTKAPPAYNLHTPVIFRMLNGECIALFPTIPWSDNVNECTSYSHVGQHSAASIDLGNTCRLATREEYMPLKKELQRAGYRLKVVNRIACAHHNERRAEINKRNAA